MTLAEEFKSRNFSIYGQWTGVLCIFICFAVGLSSLITNIIPFSTIVIFAALCLASAFIIIFVEIPLLLRICPTSSTFDAFIRRFATNYMRAAIYGVMSVIQWISISVRGTALIAAAVLLMFAGLFYLAAGIKGQAFQGSKTLGGAGVAQMII